MPENGFWLAYYADWSGMAAFKDELEAYRYAIGGSMQVKFVLFGKDLREQVNDG